MTELVDLIFDALGFIGYTTLAGVSIMTGNPVGFGFSVLFAGMTLEKYADPYYGYPDEAVKLHLEGEKLPVYSPRYSGMGTQIYRPSQMGMNLIVTDLDELGGDYFALQEAAMALRMGVEGSVMTDEALRTEALESGLEREYYQLQEERYKFRSDILEEELKMQKERFEGMESQYEGKFTEQQSTLDILSDQLSKISNLPRVVPFKPSQLYGLSTANQMGVAGVSMAVGHKSRYTGVRGYQ